MYLALRPPWGGGTTTGKPVERGPVAIAPADAGAGSAKPKAKRTKRRPVLDSSGQPTGVEEYYEETEPMVTLTDADRRMVTRGDDVTLPAQRLDMGAGTEPRALEADEINATINSQSGGIKDCVISSATNTDLRATITVELVVDGNGRVIRARVEAPHYLFEHGLYACAKRAALRMRFPATGAATLVTVPINLG
jgi:hypothetical protein